MKIHMLLITAIAIMRLSAQIPDSAKNNGTIDDYRELATIITEPITMPDGIKLYTDVYLPMLSDCMLVEYPIDTNFLGFPIKGTLKFELIEKGTQIIIYDSITPPDTLSQNPLRLKWNPYDSLNRVANPNPYRVPLVFTRTPYDKSGSDEAAVLSFLGYAYTIQDMRGRYSSEGVYMPMYSDSWVKKPYHPTWGHVLDKQTSLSDLRHGNNHEDGYWSIKYMVDSLTRTYKHYDPNNDGIPDAFPMSTGCIGTFGASALGNTQYQEAAAHRIDTTRLGMKCMFPIVATNEHYQYTGYQNGVFRDRIVTGWIMGQIFLGTEDDSAEVEDYYYNIDKALGPDGVHNTIHTSWDYGMTNKFDAARSAIDHFTVARNYKSDGTLDVAGLYPNSQGRGDMDASRAMVDANGEGNPNGQYSRYTNKEVPTYHLTGWWDIFIDGQIETNNLMRKYVSDKNRRLQKLVIGPWAHQTIGSTKTGDNTFPDNVMDVLGFDLGNIDENAPPLSDVFSSDPVSWFRYNLNYTKGLGEPKMIVPESKKWQSNGQVTGIDSIRIPSKDYIIRYDDFINFMSGNADLPPITFEIAFTGIGVIPMTMPVASTGTPLFPGLDPNDTVMPPQYIDFLNDVPPVRFYVVGATDMTGYGNYWFSADSFPLVDDIQWKRIYLHQNSTLDFSSPTSDEGYQIYIHDPDDPVLTTGGANMIVRTPQDDRNSQGPMNLADPMFAPYTMDREGVIKFLGPPVTAANGFTGDSLSVIGFPVCTLYAKSSPGGVISGPTDADFFIRVLDVYPDGREFFVVEGCVNVRARNYARARVHGKNGTHNYHKGFPEDELKDSLDFILYSNIETGQIYEYIFKMMPLAHTWGKNHRMKILISSSNFTRYQVNASLPMNDGEFFRRKPGDGRTYKFNGQDMAPRSAIQRIAFAPWYPTNIDLPVYAPGTINTSAPETKKTQTHLDMLLFPNPADRKFSVYMNRDGIYNLTMMNTLGQVLYHVRFEGETSLDVSSLAKGLYGIRVLHIEDGTSIADKLIVK